MNGMGTFMRTYPRYESTNNSKINRMFIIKIHIRGDSGKLIPEFIIKGLDSSLFTAITLPWRKSLIFPELRLSDLEKEMLSNTG